MSTLSSYSSFWDPGLALPLGSASAVPASRGFSERPLHFVAPLDKAVSTLPALPGDKLLPVPWTQPQPHLLLTLPNSAGWPVSWPGEPVMSTGAASRAGNTASAPRQQRHLAQRLRPGVSPPGLGQRSVGLSLALHKHHGQGATHTPHASPGTTSDMCALSQGVQNPTRSPDSWPQGQGAGAQPHHSQTASRSPKRPLLETSRGCEGERSVTKSGRLGSLSQAFRTDLTTGH